ncbi:hypothetical protein AAFF27_16070 [Xylophilus sp. GW821-FHT01B05]
MARYPLQGDSLLVEVTEGIGTVTLNRPGRHNALSRGLRANPSKVLPALQDDEIGVVILTAACARYLSFTGNCLDADAAKAWGLVLDVVAPGELMLVCHRIAQGILGCDSATVRDLKRAIDCGLHGTLDEGLAMEGELARVCFSRFDASGFGERRATAMRRGKDQAA